jgi:RNA polymerase sigma-70 factor, ECF subfamily
MDEPNLNLTQMLRVASGGDRRNLDALMSAIYSDLHRLAFTHMQDERCDHTLQPTAIVHEAYLKLIDQRNTNWSDRAHFFAVASTIIRRILLDHAREHKAAKRGGGRERVPIEVAAGIGYAANVDLLALDDALAELAELDPQQAKVVEMRYFGGLTIEEVAEVLGIGKRTVDRQWQCAKAWLFCRLAEPSADGDVHVKVEADGE